HEHRVTGPHGTRQYVFPRAYILWIHTHCATAHSTSTVTRQARERGTASTPAASGVSGSSSRKVLDWGKNTASRYSRYDADHSRSSGPSERTERDAASAQTIATISIASAASPLHAGSPHSVNHSCAACTHPSK